MEKTTKVAEENYGEFIDQFRKDKIKQQIRKGEFTYITWELE
jgi:hypothetical protein